MPKKRRRPIKPKSDNPIPKKSQAPKTITASKPVAATPAAVVDSMPVSEGEYTYVGREVRHILLITATFVLLQLGLWLVLGQTGFEDKLVDLIKL